MQLKFLAPLLFGLVFLIAGPALCEAPTSQTQTTVTPEQLFAIADQARDAGDFDGAEAGYRALAANPDLEFRTEARFRLGMMLADQQHRYREAAIEFRRILDEKPHAARVRLELARMHALLGDPVAAGREMRATQAEGLPPEVERTVRFYANALDARKRFGGSFEIAIAPDSNVNRATRSGILDTVLGGFVLNDDALALSGVGLTTKAQTYWRAPVGVSADMLFRLAGNSALYRETRYDDIYLAISGGPEFRSGRDRTALSVTVGRRWYGLDPYSSTLGASAEWTHPIGTRTALRLDAAVARVAYRPNILQNATSYSAGFGMDHAFGARTGGGFRISAARDDAADAAYSTASGGARMYVYREIGPTTVIGSLNYDHLEADERLALFADRRIDSRVSSNITVTMRALRIGGFAPLVWVGYERNNSTVAIYDYDRLHAGVGIGAAF